MSKRLTVKRRSVPDTEIKGGEHLHPLISQIYRSRGVTDISQVTYRLQQLHRPDGLLGLDSAIALLKDALKRQSRIVVVGDFDADGATATALMIRSLRAMGAQHVDFVVPNRFDYGYGLSTKLVSDLVGMRAELVITVDNGISSFDGVALAKKHGMHVIITDHHLPADELPVADAIVNPNCQGDEFPSKFLAGVGVAFYLLASLKTALSQAGWFEQNKMLEPNLSQWLDLVALGTVADVVPLDNNNRIMVHAGLRLMRKQSCLPGLLALFHVAGRKPQEADANDLAFALAPRLNAAGRLEDMSVGIALLLTDDINEAKSLAASLNDINQQRQAIQEDMQRFADSVVKQLRRTQSLPDGLCLYHKDWHQGVVGLLASRVKEAIHRPTIAFAHDSEHSPWLKGSARSVDGFHIRDALVAIDQQNPEMIKKFGGHAMAAGLTLHQNHRKSFDQAFQQQAALFFEQKGVDEVVVTDGGLPEHYFTLNTAELLSQAGPWGARFPEPLFDDWFEIKMKKEVGQGHCRLQLQTSDGSKRIGAIAFRMHPNEFPDIDERVQICYHINENHFNGRSQLQILVKHILS